MVKQTSTETLLGAFTVFLCLGMFLFNEMQGSACCHLLFTCRLGISEFSSEVCYTN